MIMDIFNITKEVLTILIMLSILIGPYIIYGLSIKRKDEIKKLTDDFNDRIQHIEDKYDESVKSINTKHREELELLNKQFEESILDIHYTDLTCEEVNNISENIIAEIWLTKYKQNYDMRDVKIIKNMENEVKMLATEAFYSLSDNLKHNILKYYTNDYFIQRLTRQSQTLFVNYTRENRPPIK
jgi:hypothetical protein